jgi:hypothetical protein
MAGYFTDNVYAILEPREFGSGRRRKDCDFAILALIAEARYGFATLSETRFRVV